MERMKMMIVPQLINKAGLETSTNYALPLQVHYIPAFSQFTSVLASPSLERHLIPLYASLSLYIYTSVSYTQVEESMDL